MLTGEYDELKTIVRNNVCAEHGCPLTLVWDDKAAMHTVRCQKGELPEAVRAITSTETDFKRGQDFPEPVQSNIIRGITKRNTGGKPREDLGILNLVPHHDLDGGAELSVAEVQALVDYASHYGLDAGRGHVVMMHARPYITIDGYYYYAKCANIGMRVATQPLTETQRHDYMIPDGDHAWLCTIKVDDGRCEFSGLGVVTKAEMETKSHKHPDRLRSPVVAAHPWHLAQKRAEWQALRRAFPIGGEQ